MRHLWNVLAFLAVVNLLAVGGFVGWLAATDRLNAERLRSIHEVLKPTIKAQAAEEARVSAEAETKAKAEAEASRRSGTPGSSEQAIEQHKQAQDVLDQQIIRMREEARQLKEQITTARAELERQNSLLETARRDFDQRSAEWKQTADDEQFQQAVGALQAQKPADAVKILNAILNDPAPSQAADSAQHAGRQRNKVVRYLAALPDRTRAKIIGEFTKSDDKLAAELLEALRNRGMEPAVAGQ